MDEIVTATVLGRWLGITDRAVRDLADKGMVVKVNRNLYDLEESVRRVVADLRRQALGRGGESFIATQAAERVRLARENADHVALENAKARGELVEAAAVEAELSGVPRTVRAGCLAIPSRAAQRLPHLSAHDVSVIGSEVRATLTELGSEGVYVHTPRA